MLSQRTKRWGCVIGWVILIYSTLYIVRPVCEFLKAQTPFDIVVNVFNFALLAVILNLFVTRVGIRKKSTYLSLFCIIGVYTFASLQMRLPEERIHFVEYGILSFLILRALILDYEEIPAYLIAFLLTSLFGLGDEGIQHILPNRYYQHKDVLLNAASGGLGLFMTYTMRRERKDK